MNTAEVDTTELGEKIVKVLKTIYDPEIPVDIYELGLIYDVFVNEARVKAFTMSDASVSKEVGGKFTMFGGSIEGIHRELVPGKKIVQDWRFTTWQDNVYSSVSHTCTASS